MCMIAYSRLDYDIPSIYLVFFSLFGISHSRVTCIFALKFTLIFIIRKIRLQKILKNIFYDIMFSFSFSLQWYEYLWIHLTIFNVYIFLNYDCLLVYWCAYGIFLAFFALYFLCQHYCNTVLLLPPSLLLWHIASCWLVCLLYFC